MLPNVSVKPNKTTSNSIIGSRAYTFLDSYVYMKNQRYNALYEKNKEVLAIENNAISIKSANVLYNAFMEEARILDSIIIRIRNFALRIKPDVIENINILIPSTNAINEFDNVISSVPHIPKFKYIHYDIKPIQYENMASFINLYRAEIASFTSINTQTALKDNPFFRDKAAQYLITTAMEHANVHKELLEIEKIKVMNEAKLKAISKFFKRKNQYISTITRDFKTFQFYLRQYSGLREITSLMKPTELRNGDVLIAGSSKAITFNDYFVLYKHFSSMIRYMMNIISYHEQQFFNKIYGLQSNIESYSLILNEVLDYGREYDKSNVTEDDILTESIEEKKVDCSTYHECLRIAKEVCGDFKSIIENDCYSLKTGKMIDENKWHELGYEVINKTSNGRSLELRRDKPGKGYFWIDYTYPQNWDMIIIKFKRDEPLTETIKTFSEIPSYRNKIKALHKKPYSHIKSEFDECVTTWFNGILGGELYLYDAAFDGITRTKYSDVYDAFKDVFEKYKSDHKDLKPMTDSYNDGLLNSDTIDAHNMINGNHAAQTLLYDDTSDQIKEDDSEIDDSMLKDFLEKNNLELVNLPHDAIINVKDEVISNFNEFEGNPNNGGVDICTLRDSWKL